MLTTLRKKIARWINPYRKTRDDRQREWNDVAHARALVRALELRVDLQKVRRIQRKA